MKIVQISTWDVPCGIAGYTKGLVKGILENGITCEVLPIEEKKLKYKTKDEIQEYFQLFTEQLLSYDIIHIQHEFSFFSGKYGLGGSIYNFHSFLKGLIKRNKKVFVTFHTEPYFLQGSIRNLNGFTKKAIRKIQWGYYISSLFNSKYHQLNAIVHTKNTRRCFIDSGFASKSVNIIKQGVTFSNFTPSINDSARNDLKMRMGFPNDAIILTMFGFISKYKGYKTVLQALRILPANYYLLIIGTSHPNSSDGALNQIINFLSEYPKIKHRVKLTGYLEFEELQNYYHITDFCLATYEPDTILSSSAALTWALSSGKPIIASKIDFFEELNEEAACLHLVTPGCAGELAHKIEDLISKDDLNQQLVNNGFIYCETNQWRNIAKRHIEIYTK